MKRDKDKEKAKSKQIEDLTNELLALLGTAAKATVKEDENNQLFEITIDAKEEIGLLIGKHGETLDSLQAVIGLILKSKFGEWLRVVVNIGDWRQKEEERLKGLAEEAAQRAKQTNESQSLYNLTPSQRRIIHLVLADDPEIETESLGEGRDRYLTIKPKAK